MLCVEFREFGRGHLGMPSWTAIQRVCKLGGFANRIASFVAINRPGRRGPLCPRGKASKVRCRCRDAAPTSFSGATRMAVRCCQNDVSRSAGGRPYRLDLTMERFRVRLDRKLFYSRGARGAIAQTIKVRAEGVHFVGQTARCSDAGEGCDESLPSL